MSLPGDETGPSQVWEGVDHGDHQRDDHNAGVYDVQLGAEINPEPKRKWLAETRCQLQTFPSKNRNRQNKQWEKRLNVNTQDPVPRGAKVQNMLSHFLSSFLFTTSRLTDYHSWFVLTWNCGNVYITLERLLLTRTLSEVGRLPLGAHHSTCRWNLSQSFSSLSRSLTPGWDLVEDRNYLSREAFLLLQVLALNLAGKIKRHSLLTWQTPKSQTTVTHPST